MKKIAVRKCTRCGKFSDLSAPDCVCGEKLENVRPELMENIFSEEVIGRIDDTIPFYVQSCRGCGKDNYIPDPAKPLTVCRLCHRPRRLMKPELYTEEVMEEAPAEEKPGKEFGEALRHVRDTAGITDAGKKEEATEVTIPEAAGDQARKVTTEMEGTTNEDDDDDDDVVDWGVVVTPPQHKHSIFFTAVRYGKLTFSLEGESLAEPAMLGRSALQADFLEQDGRVGNEHCTISFKDGIWTVTDNHARNGTFVNDRDIGYCGSRELCEGDYLKLGHNLDSMEFRVHIEVK